MQKPSQAPMPPSPGQVITPAAAQRADGAGAAGLEGYAVHTGEARSMEDVTIHAGTAPILERGEAEENEVEEIIAHALPSSGNAPD